MYTKIIKEMPLIIKLIIFVSIGEPSNCCASPWTQSDYDDIVYTSIIWGQFSGDHIKEPLKSIT